MRERPQPPTPGLVPIGQPLFWPIFNGDPAPSRWKWAAILGTFVVTLMLPVAPALLASLIGAPAQAPDSFVEIASSALQLPVGTMAWHLAISEVVMAALFLAAAVGVQWPTSWRTPAALNTYNEMFCEPRSQGLVGRWGNTASNVLYFAAGRIVLHSASATGFAATFSAPDWLFGIMLLLLSTFSTLWHSSNFNKTHYLDLWAMDHSILYMVVRYLAVGARCALLRAGAIATAAAVPSSLFVLYAGVILRGLRSAVSETIGVGPFDTGFIWSGRYRLHLKDMSVASACFFWGLAAM